MSHQAPPHYRSNSGTPQYGHGQAMYHASPSPSTSYQNQNPPAQPQPQQLSAAQQAQVTNAAYQAQLSLRKRAATDNLLGESLRSASRSKRLGGGGLGSTSAGGQKASHRALPPSIQRQIPESALFNDLLKMERKLDWEIMRKRAEINEGGFNARASRVSASNATSIHVVKNWITWGKTMKFIGRQLRHERVEEAEQRETKRTLRIFLSNTCANQPFQKDGAPETSEPTGIDSEAEARKAGVSEADLPSWTLRVEGRLLELPNRSRANAAQAADGQMRRSGAYKFSNLLQSLTVEIMRDSRLYPNGSNMVEWHRPIPSTVPSSAQPSANATGGGGIGEPSMIHASEPALDGFEIKRTGSVPVKVKIAFYLQHTPERYLLSTDLANLLGLVESTRADILNAMWSYIQTNSLLDEGNPKVVNCDDALRKIFNLENLNFYHLPELINRMLSPPLPVVLEYWVRTDKEFHKSEEAFDVEIEMEDLLNRGRMSSIIKEWESSAKKKEVTELDEMISQATSTLRTRSATRDFLSAFSRDPAGHLRTWLASQSRDLDAIIGSGISNANGASTGPGNGMMGKEEMRRSENFRGPWVEEGVVVNESQRLAERLQERQS